MFCHCSVTEIVPQIKLLVAKRLRKWFYSLLLGYDLTFTNINVLEDKTKLGKGAKVRTEMQMF